MIRYRHLPACFLLMALLSGLWLFPAGPAGGQAPPDNPAEAPAAPGDEDQPVEQADPVQAEPAPPEPADSPEPEPAETGIAVAHICLTGPVHASPPGFRLFDQAGTGSTLRDWLHRLAEARNDADIQAVALEIDLPGLNWAQAQELADALRRMDKVKPVYTYLARGAAPHYLVASAGRNVTMEPAGELLVFGLAAELTFFRDALNWLGVQPQLVQAGKYKGAAEPLTRTEPSEELKSEYNRLLDGLYQQMVSQIADQRGLTPAATRTAIDHGPFQGAEARKYKLVDRLESRHEWEAWVRRQMTTDQDEAHLVYGYGAKEPASLDFSNPFALLAMLSGTPESGPDEPTIAIVHADGVIRMGRSGSGLFDDEQFVGHESLIQAFETARLDDNIKAVVFRINSPGGSALASELIYQAAARCDRDKPVVVSISSMAASGGYYIAMGGRQILSDPAAIIGSIGVVGGKISTEGLMEKLKIRTTSFTRGANAGLALSRPWTRRELQVVRAQIDRTYDLFVRRVKQGRGEKIPNVSRIAQGRVFTARQGLDNGMIDQIGGIREAVVAAQRLSGTKARNYIDLPRPKTLADLLRGPTGAAAPLSGAAGIESRALRAVLAEKPSLGYLLSLSRLLGKREILTALPYGLDIRR